MTWRRYRGPAEKFHTGEEQGTAFATLCNGGWNLSDQARGLVEYNPSPPDAERCILCWLRADNTRLRAELEERTVDLTAAQRELAELQERTKPFERADLTTSDYERYGAAFIEALGIAERLAKRGLASNSERERLRQLAKVVPQ